MSSPHSTAHIRALADGVWQPEPMEPIAADILLQTIARASGDSRDNPLRRALAVEAIWEAVRSSRTVISATQQGPIGFL